MEIGVVQRTHLLIVTSTMGLAAAVMGAHAISHIMGHLGWQVLVVGGCAAFLSWILAHVVITGASTCKSAVAACFGATLVAAVTNSPLSFLAVSLFDSTMHPFDGIIGGMVAATTLGAFITVPLGFLFSIPYMVLVGLTYGLSRNRASEALDLTFVVCGLWLMTMGLCCLPSGIQLLHTGMFESSVAETLTAASVVLVILGAIVACLAFARLIVRRRWVARVRRGDVPELFIMAADELTICTEHMRPLLTARASTASVIVSRKNGVPSGAYRTGEHLVPVALL